MNIRIEKKLMSKNNLVRIFMVLTMMLVVLAWMVSPAKKLHAGTQDAHSESVEQEIEKGPHGGRLLKHKDLSLEITIFETGLPPEFHIYAYKDGKPLSPEKVELNIDLKRLGGKTDYIKFKPQADYLRGMTVIVEPHSFDVVIKASHEGKDYFWSYESYEGRTQIHENMAKEMEIATETVGPVVLEEVRTLTGRVQTNPDNVSFIRPRFQGVIKTLDVQLGEYIKKGTRVATVQSNESLQEYTIKAPISGVVIKRNAQVGEATTDLPMFVIADLSTVWVELDVFIGDLEKVKKGQAVMVESLNGNTRQAAQLDWVSPLTAHASQTVRARVILDNQKGQFRPGQFIRGHVTVAIEHVPLAVRQSAIQRFRDFQVVFAKFDDTYEVRMLELGRQNDDWVEVLSGIEPGTEYVAENSYIIKADIEKSGASHDH